MYMMQSVLNRLKNINSVTRTYMLGLLLSQGRKNGASMARETELSKKRFYAFLADGDNHSKIIESELLSLVKETRKADVFRVLIVDPSTIIKSYAEKIQKLCYDRSGCTKHIERCLVPVFTAVADKNVTIPLFIDFWTQQKISKTKYKSKAELAKELIAKVIDAGVSFDAVSLDGAFPVREIFDFLAVKQLKFVMRIPKSRLIKTADGISAQLKNHPSLKLHRNERAKTVKAKLQGNTYFFTIQKRKTRDNDWEEVFLVSNLDLSAKEQIATYDLRWPMEKKIRTTKQKFGMGQSQVLKISKQRAHIMAGFLIYAILNVIGNDNQKQSVDELVNIIRTHHFDELIDAFRKPDILQTPISDDWVAKSVQKFSTDTLYSPIHASI